MTVSKLFPWPDNTTRVAIVGAGVAGVVSAAHLGAAGLEVTVFERNSVAGGIWVYDERLPPEPRYPSIKASQGETFCNDITAQGIEQSAFPYNTKGVQYASPGPCYAGLRNNVSTPLLQLKLQPWKKGTQDFVSHNTLAEYIQDTAQYAGVSQRTHYNTRVEYISKIERTWHLQTSKGGTTVQHWEFDAVVVASGHYHACHIPEIPGISEWKTSWPDRVQHSKSYRRPDLYRNQNVLLIGAGVSSTDIAREIGGVAAQIYQSSRGGKFDLSVDLLPPNAIRIGEIGCFEKPNRVEKTTISMRDPIPFTIILKNGQRLNKIHRVIFCTGYKFCLPFLPQYHNDNMTVADADDVTLVTDGTQLHNLHQDIFYIPDPTLAFVGVPFYTATFSLFEFQAIAVAAVFAGKAFLPSQRHMRDEYDDRSLRKGHGREFHSLKTEEIEYVRNLVAWLNRDAQKIGAPEIEGHTAQWHEANQERLKKLQGWTQSVQQEGSLDLKK